VTAQTPDFAAIIAEALHQQTHTEWPEEIGPTTEGCDEEEGWVDAAYLLYGEAANVMLAAPIAALCPDCKGTGVVGHDGMPDMECHHQNAPTIGQALNEWAEHKAFRDEWEIWGSGGSTDSYTVQYRRRK
jgi:hypothetical protein